MELLVKIHKVGKHIAKEFAPNYYDEIGLGIDFTARDLQSQLKEKGLPWEKSKGFDGSALIGKWVSKSQFENLENISFSLEKNGVEVQRGNSGLMLWKINEIIAYVSQFFMLKKGDVIFTGTPAGVGPVHENDVLLGKIEGEVFLKTIIK